MFFKKTCVIQVLYDESERDRWPDILSFVLQQRYRTTVMISGGDASKGSLCRLTYPLAEVPVEYNSRVFSPLGLACHQRRLSVAYTLLQYGSLAVVFDPQLRVRQPCDDPLNIAANALHAVLLCEHDGEEEWQQQEQELCRCLNLLTLLLRATVNVSVRLVPGMAASYMSCGSKCLLVGNNAAVLRLDAECGPLIGQSVRRRFHKVTALHQMCRYVVRHIIHANGCLAEGVAQLPITDDLKKVIMLLK